LIERLSTVSTDCPVQIRGEILEAMLEVVSAEMGLFFTVATDSQGGRHFTGGVVRGDDEELIEWIRPVLDAPAYDTYWLPPNTEPKIMNTFIRIQTYYTPRQLSTYKIVNAVFDPMEVGDQMRAVVFDGQKLLGWIGLVRRGVDGRFRAKEEAGLIAMLGQLKANLAAADALESEGLAEGVFAVCTADGGIEHASPYLAQWLTFERKAYLKHRIRATDQGLRPCGIEIFFGAEVRVTRLDGTGGVRYLVTVDRASIISIGSEILLTPRQQEIAVFASVGATNKEIARSLDISPETVKAHMKSIYERLGVCNRHELVEALGEMTG